MPYITETARRELDSGERKPVTAGELNYTLTKVVIAYWRHNGTSYQTFNDITGALTNCAAEFYRRAVTPYERLKMRLNGDVYPEGAGE